MSDETKDPRKALGELLRMRREQAGLSRAKLGKKARVSEASIKLVESYGQISRKMFLRLIAVPDLRLTYVDGAAAFDGPQQIPLELAAGADVPHVVELAPRLNAFLAPVADVMSLYEQQRQALLARSGAPLRPFVAYFDPAGAFDYRQWLDASGSGWQTRSVLAQFLEPIKRCLELDPGVPDLRPLDVVALGCGVGENETHLVQVLLEEALGGPLTLCLQDLSFPLLSAASRHASDVLSIYPQATRWALHADLEQLGPHGTLLLRERSRRLFTLLGHTLGEVENEQRLLRESIGAVALPGDLLLLDVAVTSAEPPATRELLWKLYEKWQRGLVQRARPELKGLQLEELLLTQQGWADLEHDIVVTSDQGPRWVVGRRRSYNPARLSKLLGAAGWNVLHREDYGTQTPSSMFLCERVEPPLERAVVRTAALRDPLSTGAISSIEARPL